MTYTDSTYVKQEAHWPLLLCHLEAATGDNNS